MFIQVLGPGCPKCEKLKKNAEEAVKLAGVDAQVVKVTNIRQIASFGVMMTPALAIDGKVISGGKVLLPEEIKKFLV